MAQRSSVRKRDRSAADLAVAGIKDYIRDNHLAPGDVMPSEAVLCQELGLSRSSIREAVRILSTLDIVEVRHGYGTYVGSMSLEPLVQGLVFRTVLGADRSTAKLRHVVEAREALDLSVGAELISSAGALPMGRLREIVAEMKLRDAAGEPFTKEDQRFHRVLLTNLTNPLIRELSDAFWQVHMQVVPVLGVARPADMEQTIDAHGEILDAIEASDLSGYQRAVRRHYAPLRAVLDRAGGGAAKGTG